MVSARHWGRAIKAVFGDVTALTRIALSWLRYGKVATMGSWSGRRESNPYLLLGRQGSYHYTTPALQEEWVIHTPERVKPIISEIVSSLRSDTEISDGTMLLLANGAGCACRVACLHCCHVWSCPWNLVPCRVTLVIGSAVRWLRQFSGRKVRWCKWRRMRCPGSVADAKMAHCARQV